MTVGVTVITEYMISLHFSTSWAVSGNDFIALGYSSRNALSMFEKELYFSRCFRRAKLQWIFLLTCFDYIYETIAIIDKLDDLFSLKNYARITQKNRYNDTRPIHWFRIFSETICLTEKKFKMQDDSGTQQKATDE